MSIQDLKKNLTLLDEVKGVDEKVIAWAKNFVNSANVTKAKLTPESVIEYTKVGNSKVAGKFEYSSKLVLKWKDLLSAHEKYEIIVLAQNAEDTNRRNAAARIDHDKENRKLREEYQRICKEYGEKRARAWAYGNGTLDNPEDALPWEQDAEQVNEEQDEQES